jgi:hypothetical protein
VRARIPPGGEWPSSTRALSLMVCRSVHTYLGCWAPVAGRRTSGRTSGKPPFSAGRRPSIVPASSAPGEPLSSFLARSGFSFGPRSLLIGPSQEKAHIVQDGPLPRC